MQSEYPTLQDILRRGAREFGDRTAVSMVGGGALSYAGLLSGANAAAGQLYQQGVRAGDKVAILSENGPAWVVAYFAVTASGAVAVPLMNEFPASQILHILDHSQCRALVVSRRLRDKALGAEAERAVIDIEELCGDGAPSHAGAHAFELPPVAGDDLAAVIYTSGTTGVSKGVMLTHRNIVFDASSALAIIEVDATDRLLSVLPLAHAYECTLGMIAPIMHGASVYYLDRPASASVLLPALREVRPTIMLSVPLIIEKLYRSKVQPALSGKPLLAFAPFRRMFSLIAGVKLRKIFGGKLKVFAVGGSALAPDVERFLVEAGFPYAVGYGLTETSPVVAGAPPKQTRPRAVGPAVPGVEVRIAAETEDGVGEIQVRGPNVMKGYYRDPQRTREAFTADGWLHSGDLGSLDATGRLSIRGRIKTMILGASGENIYPEEIEAAINQSRYVEESVVYGDGGGVSALVQLKPGVIESLVATVEDGIARTEQSAAALLEQIKLEVNARLASFCRIHRIELQRVPFEKTPSQKIKRFLYPDHRTA